MELKVIAFDLFGTVFNLAGVPRDEIRAYLQHVTQPEWAPLALPKSWEHLPPFADADEGIFRLRQAGYTVVTLSNAPLGFQIKLLKNAGLHFDGIIPLEMAQVYKPLNRAYLIACEVLQAEPREITMVTGNETFAHFDYGDCYKAKRLGMNAQLIRNPGCPQTIIDLAEQLGC